MCVVTIWHIQNASIWYKFYVILTFLFLLCRISIKSLANPGSWDGDLIWGYPWIGIFDNSIRDCLWENPAYGIRMQLMQCTFLLLYYLRSKYVKVQNFVMSVSNKPSKCYCCLRRLADLPSPTYWAWFSRSHTYSAWLELSSHFLHAFWNTMLLPHSWACMRGGGATQLTKTHVDPYHFRVQSTFTFAPILPLWRTNCLLLPLHVISIQN